MFDFWGFLLGCDFLAGVPPFDVSGFDVMARVLESDGERYLDFKNDMVSVQDDRYPGTTSRQCLGRLVNFYSWTWLALSI